MKPVCFVLLLLPASFALFAQNNVFYGQEKIAFAEGKAASGKAAFTASVSTGDYDVIYHRMSWRIRPDSLYIKGSVTTIFKSLAANLSVLHFDFNSALTVDSVTQNNTHLSFTQSADELAITPASPVPAQQVDSVTIYYQGVPNSSGFGSFRQTMHEGIPVIWTLSEPYGAKDWWPCKQSLKDKADSIDVYVSCPTGNKAASNGLLADTVQSAGNTVFHWKHRYPIATYLVAVAVTNYAAYNDTVFLGNDTLQVVNYVFPETLTDTKAATRDVVGVMQLYSQLFGKYPFIKEKYGHAQFGWGGGMEHQTMSFMGAFNHDLLAHELAHQWFGDKVTCGSWKDLWLNEGFATYLTGLTFERLFDGYYWPIWKNNQVKSVTEYDYGSVNIPDTNDVARLFSARLTYAKAAYLLHMMRWVVGDSAFFKGVNHYLEDPACAYGFALTPRLIDHIQNTSGKNLSEFMSDWYYGEGFPSYTVQWSQDADNKVLLTIDQKQSHPSVSFYEMPVPILFKGEGKDSIVVFDHTFSGQSFTASLGFRADSAFFDPELHILSARNAVYNLLDSLADQVKIYPNPGQKEIIISGGLISNPVTGVQFLDMTGRVVKDVRVEGFTPHNGISINVEQLRPGAYTLRVTRKNSELITKWCKV